MKKLNYLLTIVLGLLMTGHVFSQPTLSSPSNGSTTVAITGEVFSWSGGLANYDLVVASDVGFTSIVETVTGITGTSSTISATLDYGTTYYWRVNDAAPSSSLDFSFTTVNDPNPPGAPTLISSVGNVLPIGGTVTWTFGSGAISHSLYLDSVDNTFSNISVYATTTSTSYTFNAPPYTYGQTYHVKIVPHSTNGDSSNTLTTSFTPTFSAVTGLDNSVTSNLASVTELLSWTAHPAASNYDWELFLGTYPTGTSFTSGSTASISVSVVGLTHATAYYFVVTANNTHGSSTVSSPKAFTTPLPPVPDPPIVTYPSCGDTTVTTGPTFIWTPDPFTVHTGYKLQVTPDPTFSYIEYDLTISTPDLSYSFTPGSFGLYAPYYFRMAGTNASGTGSYGSSCLFRVSLSGDSLPPLPVPSWPVGGFEITGSGTDLYWYTLNNIQGYTNFQIWYGIDTTLFTGAPTDTAISGYTTSIAGLTAGSTYYWTIRTRRQPNATDTIFSAWSSFASFTTPASAPANQTVYLSWPIDGNTVYDRTPTLSWYLNGPYAGLTFDIELYADSTGSSIETASGLSSSSYDVTTLLDYATTYYWRARTDNGASGTWSYFESFEVYDTTGMGGGGGGGSPTTPYLTWPSDASVVWNNYQILSWYILTAGTDITYTLNIAEDAAFTVNSVSFSGLDYPTYGLTALEFGQWYYWRVNSTDGFTTSAWSDTFSFFVTGGGASGIPILYNPGDGWTIYQTDPTLYWFTTAPAFNITYQLEYDIVNTFASAVTVTGLTDSWYSLSGLTLGQTYYWRVRTHNGLGYTAWSATSSFTVSTGAGPITPLPGSPAFGVNVGNNAPKVSWYLPTQTNTVLEHELEYSISPDFSSKVSVNGLNKASANLSGLNPNTTYYWRARTKDGNGNYSTYSQPAVFRTGDAVTSNEEPVVVPIEFSVSQNYPNPFNPTTNIKFSIPENGFVTVKIYNILGRELKTLLASDLKAGVYLLTWNGEDEFGNKVSSGNYIYRITSGNYVKTMKMTLLK